MPFRNIANEINNHHVLSCPCKSSAKMFQDHIPMKELSPKAALMIAQVEDAVLCEQIVRSHYTILARKFDPDGYDPSMKEQCTTIMRYLNTCYITIQAQLVAALSDVGIPGKDRKVFVNDKVYTQYDEFTISCQHKNSFSIYAHPDHMQIWKEAIEGTGEFPPSNKLPNGSGIQFGKKLDSIFISLYHSGSILVQGLMAISFGMDKLEGVQALVSEQTRGTTPNLSKRSDHFTTALAYFPPNSSGLNSTTPLVQPVLKVLGSDDSVLVDEEHPDCPSTDSVDAFVSRPTDDRRLSVDSNCSICLTNMTMLKDALDGLKVAAERIQRLEAGYQRMTKLENTVVELTEQNRQLMSLSGPKMAQLGSRVEALESRESSVWDNPPANLRVPPGQSPSQPRHTGTIAATSLTTHNQPGSTRVRPTSNAVRNKSGNIVEFCPERCLVVQDIQDLPDKDDNIRKVVGKLCGQRIPIIIERIQRYGDRKPKLMIQMTKSSMVDQAISCWKDSEVFGGSKARKPVKKSESEGRVGYAKHVPLDITDEDLNKMVQEAFTGAQAQRLFTREGKAMGTVRVTFSDNACLLEAVEKGLPLRAFCIWVKVEMDNVLSRITQCYKCWQFGHIAIHCTKQTKCRRCADTSHRGTEASPCTAPMKCSNCGDSHESNNWQECSAYQTVRTRLDNRNTSS